MKDKVELQYTSYGWQLTIKNDFLGEYSVNLPDNISMAVGLAISTARNIGRKEGPAKKKHG